jgi:hypothetical protein
MDRAYRGRPCSGGVATHSDQPIRSSPPATATFITGRDQALGTGALYKGWEVTIRDSQPRNHAPRNRLMRGSHASQRTGSSRP